MPNKTILLIMNSVEFMLVILWNDASEETRKTRRSLLLLSMLIFVAQTYPDDIKQLLFIHVENEHRHDILISILGLMTGSSLVYFIAMLLRDYKHSRLNEIEDVYTDIEKKVMEVKNPHHLTQTEKEKRQQILNREEWLTRHKSKVSLPYMIVAFLCESIAPIAISTIAFHSTLEAINPIYTKALSLAF